MIFALSRDTRSEAGRPFLCIPEKFHKPSAGLCLLRVFAATYTRIKTWYNGIMIAGITLCC